MSLVTRLERNALKLFPSYYTISNSGSFFGLDDPRKTGKETSVKKQILFSSNES
jgi:hypothetical protein